MAQDAMGMIITEVREYLVAHGQPNTQVRGGELQPGDRPPVVVISHSGQRRRRRVALVDQRFDSKSYGTTPQAASELARLVSDAIHDVGPRIRSTTGVHVTSEELGGQASTDPPTGWPYELAVINSVTHGNPIT